MNTAGQFEEIVREHYQPLFRFAMSLTRSEADAQDLTQQTFCIWAAKGHQLRDASKAKGWLFTTLHRAFLEARRKQGRFAECPLDEIAEQSAVVPPEVVNQVDSSEVLVALAKVDEVYRAAVALFYLEDCPYKDIAEILEVPLGTVKSRIARGIVQLREILLSGESRGAFSREAGTSPLPNLREPAAPLQNRLSLYRRRAEPKPRVGEAEHADWDFSSTLLPGLLGNP